MAKRRVVVEESPRRREKTPDVDRSDLGPVKRADRRKFQTIPTGNIRHMGAVREGRLSGEVFSRANREKIPVDKDVDLGGEREMHNAAKKLREGREEGIPRDDKEVRTKEGSSGVLRDSKQKRSRKKPDTSSEQRVQKAKARKKVTKRER